MELFPKTKDFIRSRYFFLYEKLCPSKIKTAENIPIIINNFNRLEMLLKLIDSLNKRGLHNIYILDNKSSFPPLLEYYKTSPYEIIHLGKNIGFKALWKHKPTRKRFCNDYYIYTDPDITLDSNCPDDIVEKMFALLKHKYPYAFKIGPSIRIDDLPECYALKNEVVLWEQKYSDNINDDELHRAPIDTTFALYRPRIGLSRRVSLETYRMAKPYQIKHLPWYADSENPTQEDIYYKSQCIIPTAWSNK